MTTMLHDDERLIVMDVSPPENAGGTHDYSLQTPELKRLADVGVRTITQPLWWTTVEPEFGKRDWSLLDNNLKKSREAGMRVSLGCYHTPPACFPDEWYMKNDKGHRINHLSPWNEAALEYEAAFVREVGERYAGGDVLVRNSLIADGETLFPGEPFWCDPAGSAAFKEAHPDAELSDGDAAINSGWLQRASIERMKAYQELLLGLNFYNDIWFQVHPYIHLNVAGTQWVDEIFAAMREHFGPEVNIYWLLYTYYEFGRAFTDKTMGIAETHNLNLIVGAQHCGGLVRTLPRTFGSGRRLLCGPKHHTILPDIKYLEDWQVEAIQKAINELAENP